MLGRRLISPDKARKPQYDVVYNPQGRIYSFPCNCGAELQLDLNLFLGQWADARSVLGAENEQAVREHFGIVSRSIEHGWPRLRVESCGSCSTNYLVYVSALEPRNGWHQLIVQGITELVPSNNSFKRTPNGAA